LPEPSDPSKPWELAESSEGETPRFAATGFAPSLPSGPQTGFTTGFSTGFSIGFDAAVAQLRASGGALALPALAAHLLALRAAPPPDVARRIVAAAIGVIPAALPDPLELRHVETPAGPITLATDALAADAPWRALPLDAAEFLVVDLETTGLARATSSILEIGAVRIAGGCVVERFGTLVHPGAPIPPAITALTGIDDLLVRGAPPLAEAIGAFSRWLGRHPEAPFVAHNASFDEGFVSRALALHGLPSLARPVLCTRKLARRVAPELKRYALDRLATHFGVGFGTEGMGRHRALGDADVTATILLALLVRAREDGTVRTLGDLADLEARKPPKRRPQAPREAPPSGSLRPPWVAST
jgi:DNA polymerase III epsilon subunit family exonuclease